MDHHRADNRFTGLGQQLIVFAQPPVAIALGQRPLNNPLFAVYNCEGHWDDRLNWKGGHMWPQDAILIGLLTDLQHH